MSSHHWQEWETIATENIKMDKVDLPKFKQRLRDMGLVETSTGKWFFPEYPDVQIFKTGAKYLYYQTTITLQRNRTTKRCELEGSYISCYANSTYRFPMSVATDDVLGAFVAEYKKKLDASFLRLKEETKKAEREAIMED